MNKVYKAKVIITNLSMPLGLGVTQKIEIYLDKKKYNASKVEIMYRSGNTQTKLEPMKSPYKNIREQEKKY